jgi:hypothetical protein
VEIVETSIGRDESIVTNVKNRGHRAGNVDDPKVDRGAPVPEVIVEGHVLVQGVVIDQGQDVVIDPFHEDAEVEAEADIDAVEALKREEIEAEVLIETIEKIDVVVEVLAETIERIDAVVEVLIEEGVQKGEVLTEGVQKEGEMPIEGVQREGEVLAAGVQKEREASIEEVQKEGEVLIEEGARHQKEGVWTRSNPLLPSFPQPVQNAIQVLRKLFLLFFPPLFDQPGDTRSQAFAALLHEVFFFRALLR